MGVRSEWMVRGQLVGGLGGLGGEGVLLGGRVEGGRWGGG